ncbi:unnamed protein product [Cylicocyclus nassatus]|uniref:Uncharacterized protein n=1 Tax=Cylicocyclus nassatus TaxID=53992 RepID=A0AA36H5J0_CYLNA|nr:unnamed protein product [Cylicocyclus nassatus]
MVCDLITKCLILLIFKSQAIKGIRCHKTTGSDITVEKNEQSDSCIMYNFYGLPSCSTVATYHDFWNLGTNRMDLPICGVFISRPLYLAACLCNRNYCNSKEKLEKHLAETWEQRVKEAGMELEAEASSKATGTSAASGTSAAAK